MNFSKSQKIIMIFIMIIFVLANVSHILAFSVKLSSEKQIKQGEEFTVMVQLSEAVVTSDFHLKYDTKKFDFVKASTEGLYAQDYKNDGYIIAVYADLSGVGTNKFSFTFKAKELANTTENTNSSNFSITDASFTNIEGKSYENNSIENIDKPISITVVENTNSGTGNGSGNSGTTGNPSNSNNGNGTNNGNSASNKNDQKQTGINGSTTNNNVNSSNKDKQTKSGTIDSKAASGTLPKTGINSNVILIMGIGCIILSIISFIKMKKYSFIKNLLPIFLFSTILIAISANSTYACTITPQTEFKNEYVEGKNVLLVLMNMKEKDKQLTGKELKNIYNEITEIKDAEKKEIEDNQKVGTGSIIKHRNKEYTVLVYGDVNGDGKINSGDIFPVINHILGKKELKGIYAKAANLDNDSDNNDTKINSSDIFPLIQFILGNLQKNLVSDFPTSVNPKMDINVGYSTTQMTNKNVTVIIESKKEELEPIDGWTMFSNKKQLIKEFEHNTNETITVKDVKGNTQNVNIEIDNIDKEGPKAEISYSTTNITKENITVTIKSDEEIQAVSGWEIDNNKKQITKVYETNTLENVTLKDILGNETKVSVNINNIDKINPTNPKIISNLPSGNHAVGTEMIITISEGTDEHLKETTYTLRDKNGNEVTQDVDGTLVGKITLSKNEQYKLIVKSVDFAGNIGSAVMDINMEDYSQTEVGINEKNDLDTNYNNTVTTIQSQIAQKEENYRNEIANLEEEIRNNIERNTQEYNNQIVALSHQKSNKADEYNERIENAIKADNTNLADDLRAAKEVELAQYDTQIQQLTEERDNLNLEYQREENGRKQSIASNYYGDNGEIVILQNTLTQVQTEYNNNINILNSSVKLSIGVVS